MNAKYRSHKQVLLDRLEDIKEEFTKENITMQRVEELGRQFKDTVGMLELEVIKNDA